MTNKVMAIIAAITLVVTVLFLVLMGRSLTQQEFFGVRLIMALASGAIVALLPGFINLEIKFLKDARVRGGGAVAVVALLMYVNPPFIESIRPVLEVLHTGFLGNLRSHLNARVPQDEFSLRVRPETL